MINHVFPRSGAFQCGTVYRSNENDVDMGRAKMAAQMYKGSQAAPRLLAEWPSKGKNRKLKPQKKHLIAELMRRDPSAAPKYWETQKIVDRLFELESAADVQEDEEEEEEEEVRRPLHEFLRCALCLNDSPRFFDLGSLWFVFDSPQLGHEKRRRAPHHVPHSSSRGFPKAGPDAYTHAIGLRHV
jgi:hypothetical protein